jgi:hypothetical protein
MLILEALRAKYGDALLLHYGTAEKPRLAVIDGGPPGVYADALKPRLDEIRQERGLAEETPLDIELMMVSHIDEDHIAGLLQMVRKLKDLRDAKEPAPWRIRRFWLNSFDDILGNQDASIAASGASVMTPSSLGDVLQPEGSLVLASVGQGRELRNLLTALNLGGNPPFNKLPFQGMVLAGHAPIVLDNVKLTVVAPSRENLAALQEDWDKKIKPILKKEKDAAARTQIASYVDSSVYNLSSIVVLVEAEGKRILLTGDGRGDHTLQGLEQAGLLDAKGNIEVDVLKMPHHGSIRDIDLDYLQKIRARHFVFSADGKFSNPDLDTLKLLSKARPDDDFTIHLTYQVDGFNVPDIGKAIGKFFAAEKAAGRKYKVEARKPDDLSFRLELG